MTFGKRIAMAFRIASLEIFTGIIIIVLCVRGLITYEPIPDKEPFTSTLPFEAIYTFGVVIGLFLILFGYFRANR